MLNRRRKELSDPALFASFHRLALGSILNDTFNNGMFDLLAALNALQIESNRLIRMSAIQARTGYSAYNTMESNLLALIDLGYIDRTRERKTTFGKAAWLYNVTEKGEYVLRAYAIEFARLLADTPLSKWRRMREFEQRDKERLRSKPTKGKKLY